MEVKAAQNLGVVVGLALLLAVVGLLAPGTALANGCNLPEHQNPQVDRILTGIINEDLVIEDKVCIGSTDPAVVTEVNGDILIKSGGVVKLGGFERPATVNGDVMVESGGKLQVKDRINGDVIAFGKAKIDLPLKARVGGDVIHHGFASGCSTTCGHVNFKGGPNQEGLVEDSIHGPGARVEGDVLINGGTLLMASGPNEANFIKGDIICDEFSKVENGTSSNWDGVGVDGSDHEHDPFEKITPKTHDHEVDGILGGDYECAA